MLDVPHANVWEETAVAAPVVPTLAGEHHAQVLIVGAGYLGLSAALHLAQAGADVVVVDAHAPGWGASGWAHRAVRVRVSALGWARPVSALGWACVPG